MGCQTDSDGRPGLPCELYQSGSLTDGKPLPFEFECLIPVSCAGLGHLLMANLCPLFALPRLRLPTRPPPIDLIRVITEVEKNHPKNQGHTNS